MFGITKQGNSVCVNVHNFTPYFYVEVDTRKIKLELEDLHTIKLQLNKWSRVDGDCVRSIELVKKASVMHYQEGLGTFLKIYTVLPKYVNQLRTVFESQGYKYKETACFGQVTYESNLPYALRFMIDNEIVGMSWIRIAEKKYIHRPPDRKLSNCQIEIDVIDYNSVECLPCDGEYSSIAPLRILSFDIECSAE